MQVGHIKVIVIEPQDFLTVLKKELMMIQCMMLILIIIMILSVPIKGNAMEKNSQFTTKIKESFQKINFNDGINKDEAVLIAQNDLISDGIELNNLNIKKPQVEESGFKAQIGDCWAVIFNANLNMKAKSGLKWYTMHIDKKTGEIKARGWGPS